MQCICIARYRPILMLMYQCGLTLPKPSTASSQHSSICTEMRSVLQSLVTSLVLSRLDYGNAILAGIPSYLVTRLQSVINAAARLVFSSWSFDHITPLQLHWLKASGLISSWQSSCTNVCMGHLAGRLCQPADLEARRCLRSASSPSLIVRRTRRSTIGDRAFPVAGSRVDQSNCHSTLRLHPHCLSSAAASRLTSFGAVCFP